MTKPAVLQVRANDMPYAGRRHAAFVNHRDLKQQDPSKLRLSRDFRFRVERGGLSFEVVIQAKQESNRSSAHRHHDQILSLHESRISFPTGRRCSVPSPNPNDSGLLSLSR